MSNVIHYKKIIIGILASLASSVFAYTANTPNDSTAIQNTPDQGDLSDFAPPPIEMQGDQPLPFESTGVYPSGMMNNGIPNSDQSGFAPPATTQMQNIEPLPLEPSSSTPAGMSPAQDIPIPGEIPVVETQAAPLIVDIEYDISPAFTMGNEVVLVYKYFYSNVRRVPWEGNITFTSSGQSVSIPRSSAVKSLLLFLRPAGAGSVECVPVNGQSPEIFNDNTNHVMIKGSIDADGNFQCQLMFK